MIRSERIREGLLVHAEGRLDSSTAEGFRMAVVAQIEAGDRAAVIDLAADCFCQQCGVARPADDSQVSRYRGASLLSQFRGSGGIHIEWV